MNRLVYFSIKKQQVSKICKAWANGGGSSPGACLKNHKDLIQELINIENSPNNLGLKFKKKMKAI